MSREGKSITPEDLAKRIVEVDYKTIELAGQKMMFCGIKMDNGFVVVGKPATCVDPARWSDEKGQDVSYENSYEKLWELEAYRLMSE
jgi:hypothetical protein